MVDLRLICGDLRWFAVFRQTRAFFFAPSLTRVSPISNWSKTVVRGSANHMRCLRCGTCLQLELACRLHQPWNKSAVAIAIDMHATFAHWTYSTNRRLPNVRKIKCKYICAETVPTTARQYAGKQRNDRTNQIAAIEWKACRLWNRGSSHSFSTFNRLENS